MVLKTSTLLARQFFRRRHPRARTTSSLPPNSPPPPWHSNAPPPRESHRIPRTSWSERKYDAAEPSELQTRPTTPDHRRRRNPDPEYEVGPEPQTRPTALLQNASRRSNLPGLRSNLPGFHDDSVVSSAVLQTVRTRHGLTIRIHNVPREALISEVLDIVLAGPIYRVDDYVQRRDDRVIAVTFYHSGDALAFYEDATSHKVDLFGRRPEFAWAKGTAPRWHPTLSRSLNIWDEGQLGTDKDLMRYLSQFGPIDRISLMKNPGGDRAFVNYLNAESSTRAAEALSRAGATVSRTPDRGLVAAKSRTDAIKTHSRTVILRGIPTQTSLPELCDHIRGGAIQRINFVPESGVAYVHFVEHSSAAYFLQHTIYQGTIIHKRRLNAVFSVKSEPLPNHMISDVELGATRCLGIEGIVNPDMLRDDCLQYGNVERVTFSESMSIVAFTNIQHAVRASRMLPTKVGYQGLTVTFVADPCAVPYPRDMQEAASLQAEIASLLIPAKVQALAYAGDGELGSLMLGAKDREV
ncbi:hypothetical protein B0H19DRAFT_1168802 [Mycena capillaripes]|nr:hypothetical protein B0H19DRAFT_1168802 [Mycena capillaripes]